jgi:hypothetical protein
MAEDPKEISDIFKMFGDQLKGNLEKSPLEQVRETVIETTKQTTAVITAFWLVLVEKGIVNDEVDGARWLELQEKLMPAMDQKQKEIQDQKAIEYAEENPEEVAMMKKLGLWEGPDIDEPKKQDKEGGV